MDIRIRSILRELLSADAPITGTHLASLNSVTDRTTREDIKVLDSILASNGARIESVMGKGYKLEVKDHQLFRDYLQSNLEKRETDRLIPRSPDERVSYIIRRLLLHNGYLKLDDLADEIYISKSTLQNDFKQVKRILDKYDITLETRPNYGLRVAGNEMKLRFCMAEYVFERDKANEQTLLPLPKKDLDIINEIILRQIKENQITLSDIAIHNLLIHIAIACKRIISGNHVDFYNKEMREVMQEKEYRVAEAIVREAEHAFHIDFPDNETAYIAIHLLGTKMIAQTGAEDKVAEQVMDEDILQLILGALEKLKRKLNLDLRTDQELLIGLSLHLKPAINRYKYGMNIRNPMLDDIKKNYPLAFEAGLVVGLEIEQRTGTKMNENEVGYLALHIGAAMERRKMKSGPKRCLIVCASGLGTAQLIYYKLINYFGKELEVIGTTEYYNLKRHNLDDVDFIVSSIPITEKLPVPVVSVNAIINDDDLAKIHHQVLRKSQDAEVFFARELMFLRKKFHSQMEVLRFLHETLFERGLVEPAYLEAVLEREKVASTAFGNLVAIPHPITSQSSRTFLAVLTLEKPVAWNGTPVQFVCALNVKRNSQEDLQAMYELLGRVIDNPLTVQRLIKVKTYEEFTGVIREQEG